MPGLVLPLTVLVLVSDHCIHIRILYITLWTIIKYCHRNIINTLLFYVHAYLGLDIKINWHVTMGQYNSATVGQISSL